MRKELIDRLAQAAGYEVDEFAIRNPRGHATPDEREFLERFADQVAEECATAVETTNQGAFGPGGYLNGVKDGAKGAANIIRAKFPMPRAPS